MEAKDTVMKDVTPVGLLQNQNELDGLLREQAEISFKAGREEGFTLAKVTDPVLLSKTEHEELNRRAKAFLDDVRLSGIKEVVEWIEWKGFKHTVLDDVWQAQLKEWGIK